MGNALIQLNACHCVSSRNLSPRTATPKKPITTEGIAEMNSMYGLMRCCSAGLASSLT